MYVVEEWVGVTVVVVVVVGGGGGGGAAAAAAVSSRRSPDESVTRAHHEEVDNLKPIHLFVSLLFRNILIIYLINILHRLTIHFMYLVKSNFLSKTYLLPFIRYAM